MVVLTPWLCSCRLASLVPLQHFLLFTAHGSLLSLGETLLQTPLRLLPSDLAAALAPASTARSTTFTTLTVRLVASRPASSALPMQPLPITRRICRSLNTASSPAIPSAVNRRLDEWVAASRIRSPGGGGGDAEAPVRGDWPFVSKEGAGANRFETALRGRKPKASWTILPPHLRHLLHLHLLRSPLPLRRCERVARHPPRHA
jgi:hypothetical protein